MRRILALAILGLCAAPALAQDDLAALTRKARELEDKGQTDAAVKVFAQAINAPDSPAVADILDRYCSMLLRTVGTSSAKSELIRMFPCGVRMR